MNEHRSAISKSLQDNSRDNSITFFKNYSALIAEGLVLLLLIIIISQTIFLNRIEDTILSIIIFSLTSLIGAFLIFSIRREKMLRKESERLTAHLTKSNNTLSQLDQLKSEFIDVATHQLRTPLTAIRGYLSMILENNFGDVPDAIRKPVQLVNKTSENMVDTIEYFLDATRIEKNNITYNKKYIDAKEIIHEVYNATQSKVSDAHLVFLIDINTKNDFPIFADPKKIKQVIINLVENAIYYTNEGSITISLRRRRGFVYIEVKDTGIGLTANDYNKIFTKFGRTKSAEKQNVFGAGLGLYIAKHIINDHGGTITVRSKGKNSGSVFTVTFPISQNTT